MYAVKPLCIFFVTNNYTPFKGGVVSSINSIVVGLRDKGHTVYIITFDFTGKSGVVEPYVIRVPVWGRFIYKGNFLIIPRAITTQLERITAMYNPAVMHVHHPFLLGVAAHRVAQKYGIPTIFTYHTMYEHYAHYVPLPIPVTQYFCMRRVLQFCKTMSTIIAPSSAIKEYLCAKRIGTPICVLPSPLQKSFTTTSVVEKPSMNPIRLLYLGRIVKEKNVFVLIDLAVLLRGCVPFVLYIAGYGAEYDALREYAYTTHAFTSDEVVFVHRPPFAEILNLYRTCHLFIFASHTDTQGIVLAEALSQGTPVIALDGPGQRDCIVQGVNGFLVRTIAEMCDCIIELANDTARYALLSHGAIKTARIYDSVRIVECLERIYVDNIARLIH